MSAPTQPINSALGAAPLLRTKTTRVGGALVQRSSCNVVVNGSTTHGFKYTKGIRQGSPLGQTFFLMSIEPLITSLAADGNIRGFPLAGREEINVLAYAGDLSLFVRDTQSLQKFHKTFPAYADVSEKGQGTAVWNFPPDTFGSIETVTTVKVLGVHFSGKGVTAWEKALERANQAVGRIQHLDLNQGAVIPNRTASEFNKLINTLLWDGKLPARRNLLKLPETSRGLGLPHVMTSSRMLAMNTRSLPNCRSKESLPHALIECGMAEFVSRLSSRSFGLRALPALVRNKGAFAKLVAALLTFQATRIQLLHTQGYPFRRLALDETKANDG
ncbi:hypothetical protein HPB52_023364 [Rhipicephalus sanguineus]|uniref:Reverse transcriptase domain-containing protein n=1 Tax=Rhipicephalus sanguineus TaxID=34632 RepID=A0A9D4QDM4_RHISA|nr:hypothetical protein HPB52_023364 [Rhipicephalus sanguineus]